MSIMEDMDIEYGLSEMAARGALPPKTTERTDNRLRDLSHADQLSEREKQHLLKDIIRLIKASRNKLFICIAGKSPNGFFNEVEQANEGVLSLSLCLQAFNEAVMKALEKGALRHRDIVAVQHLKISVADMVSDLITLHESGKRESYWQAQTDHQKALDDIRTGIDRITDRNRGRHLHFTLNEVAKHMRDTLENRGEIGNVSISYVNEHNRHLQPDLLTRITPAEESPEGFKVEDIRAADEFPDKIFSGHGNVSIHNTPRKTHYLGFRLGKQHLGVIGVHFKDLKARLSPDQEALCRNAISILDTYLDTKLKQQRIQRHRRKVERIMDRSGTDIYREDGQEKGFRTGIIRALTYLSEKTGARNIRLELDVMGDGKSFTLELCVGPDGLIDNDTFERELPDLECRSHKITVPPGIVIDDDVKTVENGTITFAGDDLDEEDQQILEMTAEKLISAVRNWRNDLHNTINFGLPPKVALLRKQGLLMPMSVEDLSMSYTDLHGFTSISERVNEITAKYGLREDYMMRLITAYDELGKEIAESSGGCFDKLGGDCLIIHAGPPYTTDRRDGLGMTEHEPMFHAVNGLKIALRIRYRLKEIQRVYEGLLLDIIKEIEEKTGNGSASTEKEVLDDFCGTHNIPRRLQVTQGITSGNATVGLVRKKKPGKHTYSSSYTVIGDEMNTAARLQGQAKPDEIVIGKRTKQLIEKAIAENTPIPFNTDGRTQDWESFKKELLETDYESFDLVPVFEETMLNLKNKQGFEFAYRMTLEKVPREHPSLPDVLSEEELKDNPGYYKIVSKNDKGPRLELNIENMIAGGGVVTTTIDRPPTEKRLVTEEDYDRRVNENLDSVLKVKDGKIVIIEYLSVNTVINRQLEELHVEPRIYDPGQVPHGIYTVRKIFNPAAHTPKAGKIVLEAEMNGITILLQVNANELLDIRDIKDKPKAKTLYDIHLYSHRKRKELIVRNLKNFTAKNDSHEQVIFIHSGGEFIGPAHNADSIIPAPVRCPGS